MLPYAICLKYDVITFPMLAIDHPDGVVNESSILIFGLK